MEGQEAAAMEAGGEDIMRQMMGEFEKMSEKEASRGFGQHITPPETLLWSGVGQ